MARCYHKQSTKYCGQTDTVRVNIVFNVLQVTKKVTKYVRFIEIIICIQNKILKYSLRR